MLRRWLMLDKKGYFFTLDAILGFSILVIGVVLFIQISVETPESKSFDFVNSVRDFYSGKVDQVDFSKSSPFANTLKTCFYDGLCELENQIDQQILILCEEGEDDCASLAEDSLNELIDASPIEGGNLSLAIWCDHSSVYNTTEFNLTDKGENSTNVASSNWVVVANKQQELYGPCVFKVVSWS
jgi:hypothetical protein